MNTVSSSSAASLTLTDDTIGNGEEARLDDKSSVNTTSNPNMYPDNGDIGCNPYNQYDADREGELGPLPPKWEKAYTESGEVYFIDHATGTSHWLDPRLSKFQKKSLEDCLDDELPYGWEKITDPQYGTYFIDHVNRRTQYENPVLQAKRAVGGQSITTSSKVGRASFTREPSELCGERFTTTLLKSSRGLGFTIVGGDDDVDEFLQIKSIVPNGPAWLDGKLQTGDLLVYVNDTCVLGFTHNQVVSLFQSITPGETVILEVCRGYPLPFDPNDPNTEVVTTIAVDSQLTAANPDRPFIDLNFDGNFNFMEIDRAENEMLWKSNNNEDNNRCSESALNSCLDINCTVNIPIVKGTMGFGFTIADSACGQRVKKILDRQRCKNLVEGDVLVEINSMNVQNKSHDEVVQVLKNCLYNQEALICVQRGHCVSKNSANKNKARKLDNGRSSAKNAVTNMYRSKTPTADLYSTQQKEILPNRPKTPLVDTRNRSKTPLAEVSTSSPSSCQSHISGNNLNDTLNANYNSYSLDGTDRATNMLPNSENVNHHDRRAISNYFHYETCFCFECKKTKQKSSEYSNDNGHLIIADRKRVDDERHTDLRKDPVIKSHETGRQFNDSHWDNLMVATQKMTLDWNESIVTLVRQETGFGFRIVGGTEEGSQVAVGHIVPGGAADLDGRICTGDEILSVDGHSVVNSSHHQVVQLMGLAAANGRVKLYIRRRNMHLIGSASSNSTYNVTVTRTENEGFGFVIISSANKAGSTIGRLIEGSPAERCGQLQVGDCIVAVNHFDITNLCHGDIVNLIKDSGYSVTLTIGSSVSEYN